MAPLSALLALGLSLSLSRTDAVILASFIGPLCCIGLLILGLWPRRLRWVLTAILLVSAMLQLSVGGRV